METRTARPRSCAVVAAEEGGDEVEMVVMTVVAVAMEIEEVTSAGDDVDGGCAVVVLVAAVVVGSGRRCSRHNQNQSACILRPRSGALNKLCTQPVFRRTQSVMHSVCALRTQPICALRTQPLYALSQYVLYALSQYVLYALSQYVLYALSQYVLYALSHYDNALIQLDCFKEYVDLTPAEAIQADYDIKAINIILQGLPTEIYALVSQHRVAKDLWEKIKLLMQGTSLTKQERRSASYAIGAISSYTKFLNTLPDEWSKFVYDVNWSSCSCVPEGDDQFDAINHMMSFLTALLSHPGILTTNNQLRTSSDTPRQQATIYDGKVTCCKPVQGRQNYLCCVEQRENTLLEQVDATKREINEMSSVTIAKEDPGLPGHSNLPDCSIPTMLLIKADDLYDYESDCDENQLSQIALMANLSRYWSDALTDGFTIKDNLTYDLNQSKCAVMETVPRNLTLLISKDVLILSMFEELNTQVMHCTNVNLKYKSVNKALTTELDRYKEEVKDLKEMQNVENSFSGSNE
ncbi:hypothetical protein Tco_0800100 [Tanacetum coccineum]|uniref:Uncharacterized protein n=1 Tax=Tanacetum coccineum TaxID=301880 RepID=A0ABQ4ZW42_9ASTR